MADDKVTVTQPNSLTIEEAIAYLEQGDLGKIPPAKRGVFLYRLAERWELDPLANPFDLIILNGKLTLYAKKSCAEQLAKNNKLSLELKEEGLLQFGDKIVDPPIYKVRYRATWPDGHFSEDTATLFLGKIVGEELSNLIMKCHTKGKRRVTLSTAGLGGFLDESELSSVPGAGAPLEVRVVQPLEPPPGEAPTEEAPPSIRPPVPVERAK